MTLAAKTNLQGFVTDVVVVKDFIPDGYTPCNSWVGVGMKIDSPEPQPILPSRVEQELSRHSAYQTEADPLFFNWQAGEATEEDWLAKRQEIRDRYPYPEGN
jgi:hypothetical protein